MYKLKGGYKAKIVLEQEFFSDKSLYEGDFQEMGFLGLVQDLSLESILGDFL